MLEFIEHLVDHLFDPGLQPHPDEVVHDVIAKSFQPGPFCDLTPLFQCGDGPFVITGSEKEQTLQELSLCLVCPAPAPGSLPKDTFDLVGLSLFYPEFKVLIIDHSMVHRSSFH